MLATTKSELIRINRPSFVYGGYGIMAAFAALITVFVFSGSDPAEGSGRGPQMSSLDELSAPGGFVTSLPTVANIIGIVILAFWAIAAATDYDTGLIRILVQAQPNRTRLLAGKLAALTLYTVIGTLIVTVVATAISFPLALQGDVPIDAWSDGFILEFLSAWGNLTLATLVWGLVGLTIALLSRSSAIAISIGIGYLMVVENLLGIVAEDATTYLPGGILEALAEGGTADLSYIAAVGIAAVYALALIGTSTFVFSRREIVS